MISTQPIDKIFEDFANSVVFGNIRVDTADESPVYSFHTVVTQNTPLTKKQSLYVLRLLRKYQTPYEQYSKKSITHALANPTWTHPFRELDPSKKIYVEEIGKITWIFAKFPYALKEEFAKEFKVYGKMMWDPETKSQRARLYDINVVHLHSFGQKHGFEFDEKFQNLVESVEEIWQRENEITRSCIVESDHVKLINATESAQEYFDKNKKNSLKSDLFLARMLGHKFITDKTQNRIETLCSKKKSKFWFRDINVLMSVVKDLDHHPVLIFLDRTTDVVDYAKKFVEAGINAGIPNEYFRILFRFKNDEEQGQRFNEWIKENNLGGEVETGKIFICQHKPPKWMIKSNLQPSLLISNTLNPHTNTSTISMINQHHTVFYVGNIRPTVSKETEVVHL